VVVTLSEQLYSTLTQAERTEAAPTTTLVMLELVEVEERAETEAQVLPNRVETAELVEQTFLVQLEVEAVEVTRTETVEAHPSLQVEAAAAELEQITTLVVTRLVQEQPTMELVAVRTGENVEAQMLVVQESL
jgi:hypothetical protein